MTLKLNNDIPGVSRTEWDAPKELVVTVAGHEVARGQIVGFKIETGTESCSNPECACSVIENEVMGLWFRVAPPQELPNQPHHHSGELPPERT